LFPSNAAVSFHTPTTTIKDILTQIQSICAGVGPHSSPITMDFVKILNSYMKEFKKHFSCNSIIRIRATQCVSYSKSGI
jgi:hypothetical protein